jgi:TM2 domain-containing membrane protein YozV
MGASRVKYSSAFTREGFPIVQYRRIYGGKNGAIQCRGRLPALARCSGFGALGFHRFYLGKIGTGILWFFTGGSCGIGCLYDAVTLPRQVREAISARVSGRDRLRASAAFPPRPGRQRRPKENPEKIVLRVARKNGGFVTPGEAALEGDISVDEARKLLEKMAAKGNAEMRVRSSGVVVYFFPEFAKRRQRRLRGLIQCASDELFVSARIKIVNSIGSRFARVVSSQEEHGRRKGNQVRDRPQARPPLREPAGAGARNSTSSRGTSASLRSTSATDTGRGGEALRISRDPDTTPTGPLAHGQGRRTDNCSRTNRFQLSPR